MSDGQTIAEAAPVPAVPPASRLGAVLGWVLLALGVACLTAAFQATNNAYAAQHAWDAALARPIRSIADYNAILAVGAAYHTATLRMYLLMIAAALSLFTMPGLLYAVRPSLLGGPVGRLLRLASANWASRQPQRNHPVSFYQGLGWALPGIGGAIFFLGAIAIMLFPADWWLIFPVWLLSTAATFMSIPLAGGSWWFSSGRQEPTAGGSGHEAAWREG